MKANGTDRWSSVSGRGRTVLGLASSLLLVPACVGGPERELAKAPVEERRSTWSMSVDGAGPCLMPPNVGDPSPIDEVVRCAFDDDAGEKADCAWTPLRSEEPISSWNLGYYPVDDAAIHEYSELSHWCWPSVGAMPYDRLEAIGGSDAVRFDNDYALRPGAVVTVGSAAGFSARAWAELAAQEQPAWPWSRPVVMLIFGSPAASGVGVIREDIVGPDGGVRAVVIWVTDPNDLAWWNWHPLGVFSQPGHHVPYEERPGILDAHIGYDAVDLERVIDLVSPDHDLDWARFHPLFADRRPEDEWEPADKPDAATAIGDGDHVEDQIYLAEDEDWFALHLEASQTVLLDVSDGLGGCQLDSVLQIYDSPDALVGAANCVTPGGALGCDDDQGTGICSELEFTAEQAGEYLVRLVSYGKHNVGGYVLSVSIRW